MEENGEYNHKIVYVENTIIKLFVLEGMLMIIIPTPVPWAGMPFTATYPYRLAINTFGVGHPHLSTTCSRAPPLLQ